MATCPFQTSFSRSVSLLGKQQSKCSTTFVAMNIVHEKLAHVLVTILQRSKASLLYLFTCVFSMDKYPIIGFQWIASKIAILVTSNQNSKSIGSLSYTLRYSTELQKTLNRIRSGPSASSVDIFKKICFFVSCRSKRVDSRAMLS